MKGKRNFLILILTSLSVLLFFYFFLSQEEWKEVNTVEVNEIVQTIEDNPQTYLEELMNLDFISSYSLTLLDRDTNIVDTYQWDGFSGLNQSIQNRDSIFLISWDLKGDDSQQGQGVEAYQLIIKNENLRNFTAMKTRIFLLFFVFLLVLILLHILYSFYLQRKVVQPLEEIQAFASEIARGNLDKPLRQSGDEIFGVFTNALDLLRCELKTAKALEADAKESQYELISRLSHDIKTPLASILAMLELKLAKDPENKEAKKVQAKAMQIHKQVDELLESALDHLEEIQVAVEEHPSTQIRALIENSDYKNLCKIGPIPPVILVYDQDKLQQVIDNVIENSYKYAGTEIQITSGLDDGLLFMHFADKGPGVEEEELDLIFTRFYRSPSAIEQTQKGAGLGLYTSKDIMERMGGDIQARNTEDGFLIEILLPLA